MPFLYIIKCSDGSYYTGTTNDVGRRFDQHLAGVGDAYTASRRPLELVLVQEFDCGSECFDAEMRVKRWSRKKKEALIAGDFFALKRLSRRRGGRY